jgi:DNA-binding beta-propeller fold protein YncE
MNKFFRPCLVLLSFLNFSCAGTDTRTTAVDTAGGGESGRAETGHVAAFAAESHYAVPNGEVAEIVTATPDGRFLYYTNASGKKIGILDITNPAEPRALSSVSTGDAEPTSAAVSPDGRYLIAVMRNGDGLDNPVPGTLTVYRIGGDGALNRTGDLSIGTGPDSVALAAQGGSLVAITAIEDEETDSEGEATIGGRRPGRVDVIVLDPENPAASRLSSVEFSQSFLDGIGGVNFSADPQPEFVAVHPNQKEAAVTLQENNAVAIIDISNPAAPAIKNIFCAGTAVRRADLKNDGAVDFSEDYRGRREPDGIAYVTLGSETCLALANEGDTSLKTFGDGVYSGGRGFSLHKMDGTVIWDSGLGLEEAAALLGHYPDSRSASRSLEVEGITAGRVFDDNILAAISERGSFAAVYRINDPASPELLKILPTGTAPEGVKIIGNRSDGKKLLVTANEGDGTINIYSLHAGPRPEDDPLNPAISSRQIPWSALSGFTSDGKDIYTIPDNARSPSVIWKLDMSRAGKGQVEVTGEIPLTKDGRAAAYDLEGICWTENGFWLAAEAAKSGVENLLIFASHDGAVQAEYPLAKELVDRYGDPKNYGFEGLAVTPGGKSIYVALQRGFNAAENNAAILRFDRVSKKWETAWYPLDQHSRNPKTFWTGLSDLALEGSRLLVVERDKGTGGTAEIKKIYAVDMNTFENGKTLEKQPVYDILTRKKLLLEKVESLCLLNGSMWIATDNDGAGWTRMLNLGFPR